METTEQVIQSPDGKEIFGRVWRPENSSPKALLIVVHGMGEHSERYKRFAKYLTRKRIAVAGYDHRGHGYTDPDKKGCVDSDDGFKQMVSDINLVRNHFTKQFSGIPYLFYAHSMGSFLTQRYLQTYNNQPDGVIYSGSNGTLPALLPLGIFISAVLQLLKGKDYKSSFLRDMVFKPYNQKFKPVRTEHDWLSRDRDEVDRYVSDPHSGFIPSVAFLNHFFKGLRRTQKHQPFAGKNAGYPVLIVSGTHDPVSNMSRGIEDLEQKLRRSGIRDLTTNLYPKGRHEMLSELNRKDVMDDIYQWIYQNILAEKLIEA